METNKNKTSCLKKILGAMFMSLISITAFAQDKLAGALDGDLQDTFGSNGRFWTLFILIDIILSTAAAVATKNPKVFLGIFFIAFIPGLLIKMFVFN